MAAVVRVPATREPSLRSIFVSPAQAGKLFILSPAQFAGAKDLNSNQSSDQN
jgi:hypothetical protein